MISTRDLSLVPPIDKLRYLTQSLAMLDAIIQRDWRGRYYSFNSKWDAQEQMASMRNGEGDSWFLIFSQVGAFLKGFDHESGMSPAKNRMGRVWPGVLSDVPAQFGSFLNEPAFSMNDTTFCIWRANHDNQWNVGSIEYPDGEDPDGSAKLLSILDGEPATYMRWAQEYYRRPLSLRLVEQIYAHKPLTNEVVQGLNPNVNLAHLSEDLSETGYPVSIN